MLQLIPNGLEETEPLPVPEPVRLNVCVGRKATPLNEIVCCADAAFRALSLKNAVLVSKPPVWGVKSMLRLQSAPGTSEAVPEQSGGVPDPGTLTKLDPLTTRNPGLTAFSVWLPTFCSEIDCGLSVLV